MALPTPVGLSYFWNLGSFLGLILLAQLFSGLLLSMGLWGGPFEALIYLGRESFYGFFLRWFHLNGASLFFVVGYFHFFRGVFFSSFRLALPWSSGVLILLLLMGTAFLGYVLPWGQMSLWGATVITNLLSTLPFVGSPLVFWVWGGFSVDSPALAGFYSLHFILPFLIGVGALFHILFLHESGSSSKLSLHTHESKGRFHPSFLIKDGVSVLILGVLMGLIFLAPFGLGDPENFSPSNPLSSPLHIQPEWYFLFAYAILRAVPNKLGGVLGLAGSVLVFFSFPLFSSEKRVLSRGHSLLFFSFLFTSVLLTWIGGHAVEAPYELLGGFFSFSYFLFGVFLCFYVF